ncbi:MAG: hypothetical protein ABFC96_09845 [Thermoguttaceae bacterium]
MGVERQKQLGNVHGSGWRLSTGEQRHDVLIGRPVKVTVLGGG